MMNYEKNEDIELRPVIFCPSDEQTGDFSPLSRAIDALVPRGGDVPADVHVPLDEYLSRLCHLHLKSEAVRYRLERWNACAKRTKERLAQLASSSSCDVGEGLPKGGTVTKRLAIKDIRLGAELEALLFAVRSGLDMTARLVAAHLRGATDVHSYARTMFGQLLKRAPDAEITGLVREALDTWVSDVRERRDAACHFYALSVPVEVRSTADASGRWSSSGPLLGIPRKLQSNHRALSVWWEDVPVLGGAQYCHTGFDLPEKKLEAHGIYDRDARLVIRRNGDLPPPPELMDADRFVQGVVDNFFRHVEQLLVQLRAPDCRAALQEEPQRGKG